jgi:mediator of RNA polymerase II transcription subunit 28
MATPGSPDEGQTQAKAQIGELEKAFQECITNLTSQEYFAPNETEETKSTVEQSLQTFLDTARRVEAFFLRHRLQLSVQKPEQVIFFLL